MSKFYTYPGMSDYLVSPEGLVMSLKHKNPKVLALSKNKAYLSCHLSHGDKRTRQDVHILVATLFCVKPSPAHTQVNHKDLDKSNNHYTNLEWVTPKQNIQHALLNGAKVGRPRKVK